MKKIIFILLCILSLNGKSQVATKAYQDSAVNLLRLVKNSSEPYGFQIARLNIDSVRPIRIHGYNSDVDDVREDCISQGNTYVFPVVGQRMEIISTSNNDNSTGTGVQKVELHYLSSDYIEHDEEITLTGTVAALTTATNVFRVNYLHSIQVGSVGVAAGNIDIRSVGGGTVFGRIESGINTIRQAIYTVPLNKRLLITKLITGSGSVAGSRYCEFLLRATAHDDEGTIQYLFGVFHIWEQVASQDGTFNVCYDIPIKFPAKTDIKISVLSDASNANAASTTSILGFLENE